MEGARKRCTKVHRINCSLRGSMSIQIAFFAKLDDAALDAHCYFICTIIASIIADMAKR